uniref:Glyco_18 domain-containing protein n=1 Tax=Caenorhabditis tropicalis TaxID=1561998 RepID=A0A1I7UWM2_9PELO
MTDTMTYYTPLINDIKREKSTVTFCKVLLILTVFFLLFRCFALIRERQNDREIEYEERRQSKYLRRWNLTEYESSKEEYYTREPPRIITAATLHPAKTTTFDPISSEFRTCGKRIVGYYSGWNNQKLSDNQFIQITHLVFSFMKIHENGTISFENSEKKSLFLEMKKRGKEVNSDVKVMFSMGGMFNSQHFSKLIGDFKRREIFLNSIISFLEEYQFDGVDVFWKWPKLLDKANYVVFLRELRQKIQNSRILSIVTPSVGFELMEGFHLNGILKYVDFINVETDQMNRKEGSGRFTGASSPLFFQIGEYKENNVDWTMRHVACTTGKPSQVNMGVPFYGRFWKGVQDPVEKGDEMWRTVDETGSSGTVFWRNIESEGWSKESSTWHDESKTAYIWDSENRMFLGYENEKSLKEKMKYTVENNLGGMTIWTLEMDDDVGSLLKAVTSSEVSCEKNDKNLVKFQCI